MENHRIEKVLTIIVPVYNMELYLDRCLASLIISDNDLFNALQVIIINDGSKDKSLDIALRYVNRYPNVFEVVDKPNGNYGSCINKGLTIAKGRYFRILDADDWFDTNQLSLFINTIVNLSDELDVLITNYTIQGKGLHNIKMQNLQYGKKYLADDLNFASTQNALMLRMHAMTFRTELLRDCNLKLQEGISYTDAEYCYYPYVKSHSISFYDINLYQYFIGREGQTVSKDSVKRNFDSFYKVGKRMLDDFISGNYSKNNKRISTINFISNSLFNIYCVYLVYLTKSSKEQINMVNEIDSLVRMDTDLNKKVLKFTYKKIPFVFLWRYFGFKLSILF